MTLLWPGMFEGRPRPHPDIQPYTFGIGPDTVLRFDSDGFDRSEGRSTAKPLGETVNQPHMERLGCRKR